eukprot:CAMPEP_0196227010 /NCGR_PEP_ID=MMETSP0912-20130531/50695_1 /TAXON_ID=49265 /ORGANISM="Thalassiosira rotula, Strain GSO102" /LENGTH=507 /DNA_ID=CAMNT_0041506527 /DNA_START=95 /DNA_END=1618 /DNA_ORIENTATION=-
MSRFFSTVYRFILVVVSITALVFTILSATSCAFVKFDHQYKTVTRFLMEDSTLNNNHAAVVDGGDSDVVARGLQVTGGDETLDPTDADNATMVDNMSSVLPLDGVNVTETVTTATTPATVDTTTPATVDTTTPATVDTTAAVTVAVGVSVASPTVDATVTEATSAAVTTAAVTAGATSVTSPEVAATTIAPATTQPDLAQPTGMGASTLESSGDMSSSSESSGDNMSSSSESSEDAPVPDKNFYGGETPYEDTFYGGDTPPGSSSAASEFAKAAAAGASQAAATASGDAGLYCDGVQSFSVTNVWGSSVEELEAELGTMSDQNQSEELARGAVVLASVFGLIVPFLMIFTMSIGWRMCCERIIFGLVAMCACVSQGVTFLFFNSERYCDGDIVNEILNQVPCVIGDGGIYSIVALLLYALAMFMACRLPKSDPYGLCCKERSAAREQAQNDGIGGTSRTSRFGLVSKGDDDDADNVGDNPANGKPERPNWLSEEDKKKQEIEEQEII